MNTDVFDRAITRLLADTTFQPKEQVWRELTLVMERFRFMPDWQAVVDQPAEQAHQTLHFLCEQDISVEMMGFLDWLADERGLMVMGPEMAEAFAGRVQSALAGQAEMRVVTAVAMGEDCRQRVAEMLQGRQAVDGSPLTVDGEGEASSIQRLPIGQAGPVSSEESQTEKQKPLPSTVNGERSTNDAPIRVVFEVLPSLLGGCLVVDESGRSFDYSIRTNVGMLVRQRLQKTMEELRS